MLALKFLPKPGDLVVGDHKSGGSRSWASDNRAIDWRLGLGHAVALLDSTMIRISEGSIIASDRQSYVLNSKFCLVLENVAVDSVVYFSVLTLADIRIGVLGGALFGALCPIFLSWRHGQQGLLHVH